MKFRIEDVGTYKKIVSAVCSIPSVRKQLNGVEQCIEISTDKENNRIIISTVDLTSHAIKLYIPAEVLEEGRQIVLSNKLKALTSKLNLKYGLVVSNASNLINYEARPFGSIADDQYFSQDSILSTTLFEGPDWKDVTQDVGFFLDLIPYATTNTYSEREVYMTTSMNNIKLYVQFSETSYIRYTSVTETNGTINDFKAALRPALLKMILLLGENVSLQYCPIKKLVRFQSELGIVIMMCDMSTNKVASIIDTIINKEFTARVNLAHTELLAGLNFQSYGTTETDIVSLSYDNEDEVFNLSTSDLTKPTTLIARLEGEFNKTTVSVGHLVKGLKAMGSEKSKILPLDLIDIQLKNIPVVNAHPIVALHLKPEEEMDVTSDIILYEASC